MKTLITEFPSLSIRKMASAIQVSTKIVVNILNDDLRLKPYKIKDWHTREVHDYAKRVEITTWCLSIGPYLKNCLICINEVYFYLTCPQTSKIIAIGVTLKSERHWKAIARFSAKNGAIFPPKNYWTVLFWR